jgi:hypothetical protein
MCKNAKWGGIAHADRVSRLVNNAGVWTTKPEAGPEDGPEKFGSSMFDQSIDLWQQGNLSQELPHHEILCRPMLINLP